MFYIILLCLILTRIIVVSTTGDTQEDPSFAGSGGVGDNNPNGIGDIDLNNPVYYSDLEFELALQCVYIPMDLRPSTGGASSSTMHDPLAGFGGPDHGPNYYHHPAAGPSYTPSWHDDGGMPALMHDFGGQDHRSHVPSFDSPTIIPPGPPYAPPTGSHADIIGGEPGFTSTMHGIGGHDHAPLIVRPPWHAGGVPGPSTWQGPGLVPDHPGLAVPQAFPLAGPHHPEPQPNNLVNAPQHLSTGTYVVVLALSLLRLSNYYSSWHYVDFRCTDKLLVKRLDQKPYYMTWDACAGLMPDRWPGASFEVVDHDGTKHCHLLSALQDSTRLPEGNCFIPVSLNFLGRP